MSAKPIPFCERLHDLLGDRTGSWLADHAGLPRSSISRYLSGERQPTEDTLARMAVAFETTPEDMVLGTALEGKIGRSETVSIEVYRQMVQRASSLEAKVYALEMTAAEHTGTTRLLEKRLRQSRRRNRRLRIERDRALEALAAEQREHRSTQRRLEGSDDMVRRRNDQLTKAIGDAAMFSSQVAALHNAIKTGERSTYVECILATPPPAFRIARYVGSVGDETPPDDGSLSPDPAAPSAASTEPR